MEQLARQLHTPEEYLAKEQAADYRSEFFQGEIFAMSGGSFNHNLIIGNFFKTISAALERKPCRVLMSDMRLLVKRNGLYTYPDVMVVCGKVQFVEGRNDTITNPILIIEVLSPSTRDYDRVKKFSLYRQLDSLRDYVLVDSEQVHVTHLHRVEDSKQWTIEMYDNLDALLAFESVGCQVAVASLYDKVEFEPEHPTT